MKDFSLLREGEGINKDKKGGVTMQYAQSPLNITNYSVFLLE